MTPMPFMMPDWIWVPTQVPINTIAATSTQNPPSRNRCTKLTLDIAFMANIKNSSTRC